MPQQLGDMCVQPFQLSIGVSFRKFLVFAGNENEEIERRYIQELLAYKIEGMIILSHTIPSHELASYQVPLVTIEREANH